MPQTPIAGITHHAVIRYAGGNSSQGLMLPVPTAGALPWSATPYNQFAPQLRQGEATDRDFSVLSPWQLFRSLNGGMGKIFESSVETNGYYLSSGTPALFTAQPGHVLPPPAVTTIDTTRKDIIQFMECAFSGGSKFLAISNTTPGVCYTFDTAGTALTAVATAYATDDGSSGGANPTTFKQMFFNGTGLILTRGAARTARYTTDGATFSAISPAISADFVAQREKGALCYVANASFFPVNQTGETYDTSYTIGWGGTVATGMEYYAGALFIFKPEGLFRWSAGRVDQIFDTEDFYSTTNGTKRAQHSGLLYFNVQNRLYFTNGTKVQEIFPEDINGFLSIDALAATFGPLLFSAHINPSGSSSQQEQSNLFYMGGASEPGLNPLMAAAVGVVSANAYPTAVTETAGVAWTNPNNILANDNARATCPMNGNSSGVIIGNTFGFSIPSSAVITGLVMEAELSCTDISKVGLQASLRQDSTLLGSMRDLSDPTQVGTSDTFVTFGSSADLWSAALTPTIVNNANFGLGIRFTAKAAGTYSASIDYVRCVIYYNIGGNTYAAIGSTRLYDPNGARTYFCESDATNGQGVRYLNLSPRYRPLTYDTQTAANQYVETTEFTASLPAVNKWWFDVVVAVRNPNATTFCRIDYSVDQGTTWTTMKDDTGASVTSRALSSLETGMYFPLATYSTRIQFRIYLWTTNPVTAAELTRFTVRGIVMTKTRWRFSFPVVAEQTVFPLPGGGFPEESGLTIRENLKTAAEQFYACDLQDLDGKWHRGVFQSSPQETVVQYDPPMYNNNALVYRIIQVNFVEVTDLDDDGTLSAWAVG